MVIREKYVWFSVLSIVIIYLFYFSISKFNFNRDKISITVKEQIIDIGNINKKEKSIAKFKLMNESNKKISILDVLSDCHCTVPNWRKAIINPNDTFELEISYDNENYGFFEQKINVYIKESKTPILLIMRGNVIE